jgi:hypothetical protein
VTHVTCEEAFDGRQEGGSYPETEEREALRRGQEGGSHQEAQDGGAQEDDGPQDDAQEEPEALGRGQEGGSHQEAQDDQKEGRGVDVADGSFSWSGRGAIAPLPRFRSMTALSTPIAC